MQKRNEPTLLQKLANCKGCEQRRQALIGGARSLQELIKTAFSGGRKGSR